MAFPDLRTYPLSHPGPYERNMGACIAGLLRLFRGRVPDSESAERVLELATEPGRRSAGHKVFDEIRRRALAAAKAGDDVRCDQYCFEELCCKAMYNAVSPRDPFDPSSPFLRWPGRRCGWARAVGV